MLVESKLETNCYLALEVSLGEGNVMRPLFRFLGNTHIRQSLHAWRLDLCLLDNIKSEEFSNDESIAGKRSAASFEGTTRELKLSSVNLSLR